MRRKAELESASFHTEISHAELDDTSHRLCEHEFMIFLRECSEIRSCVEVHVGFDWVYKVGF